MKNSLVFALALPLLISACTSVGDRTQLSVGYYSIEGKSFDELDEQIALHGPTVSGVGKALAATNVRMIPDFRFKQKDGLCRVESAHVAVKAHVTLPKLMRQEDLRTELSKAWNNLEQYARLHESVHVSIADSYATKAEEAVNKLPAQATCNALRSNAILVFRRLMAEHERDQLQFDEEERGRIAEMVNKTRRFDSELSVATQ
jgi:predicted secreted Zn-dependent protease